MTSEITSCHVSCAKSKLGFYLPFKCRGYIRVSHQYLRHILVHIKTHVNKGQSESETSFQTLTQENVIESINESETKSYT